MSILVRDDGFHADDYSGDTVVIAPDTNPDQLAQLVTGASLVSVAFPAFSDGRGFTLARRIRALGYTGRLRAAGHLIADQYAMARRSGIDEVEISDDLAARQPEAQWLARANWQAHDYRSRMQG